MTSEIATSVNSSKAVYVSQNRVQGSFTFLGVCVKKKLSVLTSHNADYAVVHALCALHVRLFMRFV